MFIDVYNSSAAAACFSGVPDPLTFNNNDDLNDGSAPAQVACDPSGRDVGLLSVDPQFVDSTNGNFRVQDASPVIYAGDINAPLIPATDLDGKNRTVCGKIDMGVYQRHPHPPISLTASSNPSAGGNNVTFTAQVTGNCNVPTGILTFFDGATPIGTGTLNVAAIASLTTAFLVVGQHTITAQYPGDFNFEDSTSNGVTETVTGFATATSLTVAPNPATAFQPITLSAAVTASYGTPSGTVTFLANGNAVGTATLNGSGTLNTSALGAGTYNVVAVFNATTQYASSTSNAVTLVVLRVLSTTTLLAQPNPVYQGQTVTFTASTVGTQLPSATATGTISFFDGGALLGTAPLSGGHATFATNTLTVGSHTITAAYSGDANLASSASSPVVEVVLASSFTISLSPANLAFAAGQPQQVTVNLVSIGNYAGTLQLGTGTLPAYASVSFNPASVGLNAGGASSSVLTLGTVSAQAAASPYGRSSQTLPLAFATLAALPLLLLRRTRHLPVLVTLLLAFAILVSATGCGYSRTAAHTVAPGTYVIPVTATDAQTNTTHTANLTVVISR